MAQESYKGGNMTIRATALRYLVILVTAALTMIVLSQGTSWAHGSYHTSDDGDAGTTIEVYKTPYNWHGAVGDAIKAHNQMANTYGSPHFKVVDSKAQADLWVYPVNTSEFGGRMLFRDPGLDTIELSTRYNYQPYIGKAALHEFFHSVGAQHHCNNGFLTVMDICGGNPGYFTAHDKEYFAGF